MDKSNNCMHIDSILEDFKEGCLICTQCCRVLEMNIPFQNLEDLQIPASAPDKVFTFIYDSCHRMNIPNSVIDGINDQYRKYKKQHFKKCSKFDTLLMRFFLLIASIFASTDTCIALQLK